MLSKKLESYCKGFLILQFPSIWYALVLTIYVILSKFIIKLRFVIYWNGYILAGVNDLMLHLVRLKPTATNIIFPLQLQEDHEAPSKTLKTDSLQLFSAAAEIWQRLWVELVYFFSYFYNCGKKLEIILNKHKKWHWFLCSYFVTYNKNVFFLISIFCVLLLVPKLGTENRGFSLVLVPNTEIFGTVTNPNIYIYECVYIYIYMCVYIQVHLIKLECREKEFFFLVAYFKKWNFHIF